MASGSWNITVGKGSFFKVRTVSLVFSIVWKCWNTDRHKGNMSEQLSSLCPASQPSALQSVRWTCPPLVTHRNLTGDCDHRSMSAPLPPTQSRTLAYVPHTEGSLYRECNFLKEITDATLYSDGNLRKCYYCVSDGETDPKAIPSGEGFKLFCVCVWQPSTV